MRKFLLILCITGVITLPACDTLNEAAKNIAPTEGEMVKALQEALEIGTYDASEFLNQPGGYLDHPQFRIPFPPDVQNLATKLRELGFGNIVDEFVTRMNRGAEDAAKTAAPIFVTAIKQMTITDAKNILLGDTNSATLYFERKTRDSLVGAFSPKIKESLEKFEVTKYWTDMTSTYNKIPFVTPVETDLVKYATNKALDGLFLKVAEEEADIRKFVKERPTALLQKVFEWADFNNDKY